MKKEDDGFWAVVTLVMVVVFVAGLLFFLSASLTTERGTLYETGTVASVVSAGEDPDGTFKIRISRGGADLQVLARANVVQEDLKNLRPGDKIIFCWGEWIKVCAVAEVVEGDFNNFHKGDRVAFTRRGQCPAPVKYWDPAKDSK